jgi:hypothetical protein
LELVANIHVDVPIQLSIGKIDVSLNAEILVICKQNPTSKKWFLGEIVNYTTSKVILIPYKCKKETYIRPAKVPAPVFATNRSNIIIGEIKFKKNRALRSKIVKKLENFWK